MLKLSNGPMVRHSKAYALCQRVDPGICAPGGYNRGLQSSKLLEDPFDLSLHGPIGFLTLPAREPGTVELYLCVTTQMRHMPHIREG